MGLVLVWVWGLFLVRFFVSSVRIFDKYGVVDSVLRVLVLS